jgi:hypothetical protein
MCGVPRLSAIGYRLSAIGYRLSAIGYRLSAIGYEGDHSSEGVGQGIGRIAQYTDMMNVSYS